VLVRIREASTGEISLDTFPAPQHEGAR
jgi:hypothetical protein